MGYDHRADENGVFEMEFTKWHGGGQVATCKIIGLAHTRNLKRKF